MSHCRHRRAGPKRQGWAEQACDRPGLCGRHLACSALTQRAFGWRVRYTAFAPKLPSRGGLSASTSSKGAETPRFEAAEEAAAAARAGDAGRGETVAPLDGLGLWLWLWEWLPTEMAAEPGLEAGAWAMAPLGEGMGSRSGRSERFRRSSQVAPAAGDSDSESAPMRAAAASPAAPGRAEIVRGGEEGVNRSSGSGRLPARVVGACAPPAFW